MIFGDMESQLETIQRVSQRKIARMKTRHEREKGELLVDFLKEGKDILKDWEFVDFEGNLYL
jgi:hypothetical protein